MKKEHGLHVMDFVKQKAVMLLTRFELLQNSQGVIGNVADQTHYLGLVSFNFF